MKELSVDVAVIGAGTAGMGAYRSAREHTDKVLLIEGGPYGTTCARVGCMPSKLLIASAEAAQAAREAPQLGVHAGEVKVSGTEVMQRVRSERDRFVGFVVESVDEFKAEHKLRGHARFVAANALQVDDHSVVKAKRVVIATGSSPAVPPPLQGLGDRLIINDDVFDWDDLPGSVAVFGPGVIGLELGQALHRLGVKTFVFGRGGRVGPLTDPALIEYCTRTFAEEFYLNPDAEVSEVKRDGEQVSITFACLDGKQRTEQFDYVLAATGRTPNVRDMGLENTGLALDERGVPLFDRYTLQAGDSSIFIAGDVNNFRPLLHEAADEGRTAGANAGRFPEIRAGCRRAPLGVVFSDPQIAMAGRSFQELEGESYATGAVSFENQGRSRVMLKNKGLLHVYAQCGTGTFLGAEMFGPRAEHIGHLLAWCYEQKLTIGQMLQMPFYHPVIEEGLRTALREVNSRLNLGPAPVPRSMDCGPGA